MDKIISAIRYSGFLFLGLALTACSGGTGEEQAAARGDVAQKAAPASQADAATGEKRHLYREREAPSGEFDDADAKLVFHLRGCNACHEVEGQRIGPPYRAMALRYAADHAENPVNREKALAAKIRFGGAGAWGNVPMISNPNVSQEEAESIARWIMGLKDVPENGGS